MRRNNKVKGICNKTRTELIKVLQSEECAVNRVDDIDYIVKKEEELNAFFIEAEKEATEQAERKTESSNITNTDRLRFLEAMLSDEVKSLYRASQDSMNRTQLDSRNSIMRIVDFYDKISAVFNSAEFLPQTKPVPDLHEDFQDL